MYLVIFNEKSFCFIFIFQTFYNEIKTQFGVSIQILQVIMVVNIFQILLINLWLLMAFSIELHMLIHLNKNGVDEHKIWYLIKTTLILLIHGEVP